MLRPCGKCNETPVLYKGTGRYPFCFFCKEDGPEPLAKYESNEAKIAAREFFFTKATEHFAWAGAKNAGMVTLTDLRESSDEPQQAVECGLVDSLNDIIGFSDVFGAYRDGIEVKRARIEDGLAEVLGTFIGQGKDAVFINLDYCRTVHTNRDSLEECLRIASNFARGVSLFIGVNVCYNHRAGHRGTTGKVVAERGAPAVAYEWTEGYERVWLPEPLFVATPDIYSYRSSSTTMQMFGIAN